MLLTSVSRSASSLWTLVLREVRATLMRVSLSISRVTFTSSRAAKAFSFAASKPSATILGWRPCSRKSNGVLKEKSNQVKYFVYENWECKSHLLYILGEYSDRFIFYLWHIEICLLQQFSNDEHIGSGSVSCDVILRCGNLCNEWCCRVLNLLQEKKKGGLWNRCKKNVHLIILSWVNSVILPSVRTCEHECLCKFKTHWSKQPKKLGVWSLHNKYAAQKVEESRGSLPFRVTRHFHLWSVLCLQHQTPTCRPKRRQVLMLTVHGRDWVSVVYCRLLYWWSNHFIASTTESNINV